MMEAAMLRFDVTKAKVFLRLLVGGDDMSAVPPHERDGATPAAGCA